MKCNIFVVQYSFVVNISLQDAFKCMSLSCHQRVSERIYTCLVVWISRNSLIKKWGNIWRLSGCNWIRTHNHLLCERTLIHLAKLVKWLSCALSNYLSGLFECIFLLCHVCVIEWIRTLYLNECQGTLC